MLWNLSTLYYWFYIPNTFNWYAPALPAFYLLTPLLFRALERCRYREVIPTLIWRLALPFPAYLGQGGDGFSITLLPLCSNIGIGIALHRLFVPVTAVLQQRISTH